MMPLGVGYDPLYAPISEVVDSVAASLMTGAPRKPLFTFSTPPPPVERTRDSAIAWAKDCISENECWIRPESNVSTLHHYIESLLADPLVPNNEEWFRTALATHRELVTAAKRGERAALRACLATAALCLQREIPMPPLLREFTSWYLKVSTRMAIRPKRGWDPHKNRMRDMVIFSTVAVLWKEFRIHPTRNEARHHVPGISSGCSIVASLIAEKGLNLSESAVEKIWQRKTSV